MFLAKNDYPIGSLGMSRKGYRRYSVIKKRLIVLSTITRLLYYLLSFTLTIFSSNYLRLILVYSYIIYIDLLFNI